MLQERLYRRARRVLRPVHPRQLLKSERRMPYTAWVGLFGVHGVRPKAHITSPPDAERLLLLVGERTYTRRFVNTLLALPENSCVLDVGAAQGAYTLLAMEILKAGHVVSIEPDPQTFHRLCRNISLNHAERKVSVLQIALGAENCDVVLHTSGPDGRAPVLRPDKFLEHEITVRMRTIDYLVQKGIIPSPDVIKIDVEGAELGVLKGAGSLLNSSNSPKHIFLEVHPGLLTAFGYEEKDAYELLTTTYRYKNVFSFERNGTSLIHFKKRE